MRSLREAVVGEEEEAEAKAVVAAEVQVDRVRAQAARVVTVVAQLAWAAVLARKEELQAGPHPIRRLEVPAGVWAETLEEAPGGVCGGFTEARMPRCWPMRTSMRTRRHPRHRGRTGESTMKPSRFAPQYASR